MLGGCLILRAGILSGGFRVGRWCAKDERVVLMGMLRLCGPNGNMVTVLSRNHKVRWISICANAVLL
jgi:hypothetical protein